MADISDMEQQVDEANVEASRFEDDRTEAREEAAIFRAALERIGAEFVGPLDARRTYVGADVACAKIDAIVRATLNPRSRA